ncbi:DsrE family protein [Kordiimonas pumila]|uniref:DsrE family protein n=1 Tax=Kordiimonas pumila TaxID=2161677 RepID=A0ABV7D4V7_9PROT|nr:DsrE family protein [Kordiimonas pumila]
MAKAVPKHPMTLLVISPLADRIHMALMMGATAAAVGRPVTFFFSKGAIRFLVQDGWAGLVTTEGTPAPDVDAVQEAKGIADSSLLMEALPSLNVRFVACETALREHDIDVASLITRPAVEISGLADVLEKGSGGDWLTF